ncbi:nucleotidyltransferase domain-containing protein [Flavobacterium sp. LAR06]|uniref:nucleotidyltransferase domain-containing protein n=1 Tax=Flavobacterium sp. LAR06 TaxID=3064897 RepID=UPI0035C05506
MLNEADIKKLVERIVKCVEPDKVIMFGSYAKGIATNKSDLDLFIIKDTPLPMKQRNEELLPIVNKLLIEVDVHVYTPEEVEEYGSEKYSFVHSVLKTGKVIYRKI